MHTIDGLNLCQEASNSIFSKCNDLTLLKEISSNSTRLQATCYAWVVLIAKSSSVPTANIDDSPIIRDRYKYAWVTAEQRRVKMKKGKCEKFGFRLVDTYVCELQSGR